MTHPLQLTHEQRAMLDGEAGPARQMAMRLLVDLAAAAGARSLTPIESAHLSGVSPLTGGLGLRRFLGRLTADRGARVAVPTTLNAAGCDLTQFAAMHIVEPDFQAHSEEIIAHYEALGVRPIKSCVPYEWDGVVTTGAAAWSESNAICFGNSYCGLVTNRESGLSALAAALTGYTPLYGLLEAGAGAPNLIVEVSAPLTEPTDYSILGDWIGRQRQPDWAMPLGPIPVIRGLPPDLGHEERKALAAAAANYGCPRLYVEGWHPVPATSGIKARLRFTAEDLATRYEALAPREPVSLIVIGCPQASLEELRRVAVRLRRRAVTARPGDPSGRPPLWVFTSGAGAAIAEQSGLAAMIRASGALLLQDTCPEVVPYDRSWVRHILTNSMKAEHYLKSGLNRIPTSVMRLDDCLALATGERPPPVATPGTRPAGVGPASRPVSAAAGEPGAALRAPAVGPYQTAGRGLPSQGDFSLIAEAFVSPLPLTFLGFVNRTTGIVEEPGHPANGLSLAGRIAIFPKGSGSTVAPYVLLELYYRGAAPLAVVNTEIDQQSAPACSREAIPYAYGFPADVLRQVNHGDRVRLRRRGDRVTLQVLERRAAGPARS